jgi:uncharacterized membrane protein
MVPGAAGRFLALAEGEANHRRIHENKHLAIVESNAKAHRYLAVAGQIFAFIIAMSGIAGGVFLALHGAQTAGSIIGGGGLVTIILAFLKGGNQK